ncbi:capsular biosynthesis protein [Listeria booriae]|uniref:YveK family protein n=1 Tax=Listeria booriae TaxID=1552123 RepID=UPI001629AFCD|nr:Wzz/FepE/Etk N-terminal domain-containing protein [Listeria booriae]MBC1576047.1 capsular biosynthesis protein [Listeria booriae]MBC2069385.1 capsular biosynthesis protein [Listeria booriae]MBC2106581.1 capsular biosynthesis protein [Listeria booriae]
MNERISLKRVIAVVSGNLGWILMIIGIPILVMLIYLNYLATPIYQKSTQLLVNQFTGSQSTNVEAQTIQADLQLVNTYSTIILSPRILDDVSKYLGKEYTTQELADMIQVKNATNSQIIDISINHPNAKEAAKIANLTASQFTEKLPKIMKIDNVTILSEAKYLGNEKPVKPQKWLMVVLSFFLGVLLVFVYIFIKLLFDRRLTTTEEIEELLNVHILGEVSIFPNQYSLAGKGKRRGENNVSKK